jgi:hypothetical protein
VTADTDRRLAVPDSVVIQPVGDEMVLLHAGTGAYYGLDAVGASIFNVVTATASVQAACDALLAQYDAEPDRLRADVDALVEKLTGLGLLEWRDSAALASGAAE